MKQNNAPAYMVIFFALIGLLSLATNLTSFDVGTQDHPRVVSLRP